MKKAILIFSLYLACVSPVFAATLKKIDGSPTKLPPLQPPPPGFHVDSQNFFNGGSDDTQQEEPAPEAVANRQKAKVPVAKSGGVSYWIYGGLALAAAGVYVGFKIFKKNE
jgi:hypothetical protein